MTLEIMKNGAKNWRVRFTFNGKPGLLSLGTIPKSPLQKPASNAMKSSIKSKTASTPARPRRKREAKTTANNTFEAIALEWMERHPPGAETTANKNRWLLGFAFDALVNVRLN